MQGRSTPNLGWIDGRADDCDRMGAPLPNTAVADVAAQGRLQFRQIGA